MSLLTISSPTHKYGLPSQMHISDGKPGVQVSLHENGKETSIFFPSNAEPNLQSRIFEATKDKLLQCEHFELKKEGNFKEEFCAYTLLKRVFDESSASLTTVTIKNISIQDEILGYLGKYANACCNCKNLHTLTVVENGWAFNRDFFSTFLSEDRHKEWESLTFIGKGLVRKDTLDLFHAHQSQLKFIKIIATHMEVSQEDCENFNAKHPHMKLELGQYIEDKDPKQTQKEVITAQSSRTINRAPPPSERKKLNLFQSFVYLFKKSH